MRLKRNWKNFPVKNSIQKTQNIPKNAEKIAEKPEKNKNIEEISEESEIKFDENLQKEDKGFEIFGGLLKFLRHGGNDNAVAVCKKISHIIAGNKKARIFLQDDTDKKFFDESVIGVFKEYFDKLGLSFVIVTGDEQKQFLELNELLGGKLEDVTPIDW